MAKKPAARRAQAATSAKSKAASAEPEVTKLEGVGKAKPQPAGSNQCTTELKGQVYRELVVLTIGADAAKAVYDKKKGEARAFLKKAGQMGVDTDALTYALARRTIEPDEVIRDERAKLEMLEIAKQRHGFMDALMDGYHVAEPTHEEEETNAILNAVDQGFRAGRMGHSTDNNPYEAGTLGYVKWADAWRQGQAVIAGEMNPEHVHIDITSTPPAEAGPINEPVPEPVAKPANRNPLSQSQKAAEIAAKLSPDRMPGGMPGIVH